jgi:dTDP-4-dehydrorhamnose reductase
LFGSTGYVGSQFRSTMDQYGLAWKAIRSSELDLTNPDAIQQGLERLNAGFVINCAGYTGKPNVDACELQKRECLIGNTVVPSAISAACKKLGIPWGHVSSGCIFTGRRQDKQGFTETDPPNFSFRQNNCSFYSGTKALGEELLSEDDQCFIWRLRIPFNNIASPRNYLQKLISYQRLLQAENSLSNLEEFVAACLECHLKRVPFGIYNVTNPGSVWTDEVVELIRRSGVCDKDYLYFDSEQNFMKMAAKTPRSNCVLDSTKAIQAGLKLSPVLEVIERCLAQWKMSDQ